MKGCALGLRHVQTALLYLTIVGIFMSRLNISVAVVAMTDAKSTNPDFPEFDWSEQQKSYILSSFFWGYMLTPMAGSYLNNRYGTKPTITISLFISAIFSLITPVCVCWGGWRIFCGIRVLQGIFQGFIQPGIFQHLAKWSPPAERNRLGAIALTSIDSGTVLAIFISGITAASSLGWPGISYVSGGVCLAVCLLWTVFGSSNPTQSRWISAAERDYIETSLERTDDYHRVKIPIPWRAIFTSVPFYALLASYSAHIFGFVICHSEIPFYMHGVLDMNIESNGLYSALPFVVMFIMSFVFLISSDVLLNRKLLKLRSLRRIINSLAACGPAVGLTTVGFLPKTQRHVIITVLTLSIGVNSGATIGSDLNGLDLSPNHAGTLMAIASTVGNAVALITPLMISLIVTDTTDVGQWQIAFSVTAMIYFVGNAVYVKWLSTDVQPWDAVDFLETHAHHETEKLHTLHTDAKKEKDGRRVDNKTILLEEIKH